MSGTAAPDGAGSGRRVLLTGAAGTWNEQMVPGEYAVHTSSVEGPAGGAPFCTVFGSLPEAVAHAEARVAAVPNLNCRIFDDRGWVGAPVREVRGRDFKTGEISPRFRRWAGALCLIAGLALLGYDAVHRFELGWPATIGARLLIPGVVLLVTEVALMLHARSGRGARVDGSEERG